MVYGRYNELGFIGVKLYQRSHHWGPPSCWKLLVWPPWAMCEMLSKEAGILPTSSNVSWASSSQSDTRVFAACCCAAAWTSSMWTSRSRSCKYIEDFCESLPKKQQEMLPSTIRPMFGIRLGIRLSHLDAAHLQDHCRPLSQVMAFHGPKGCTPDSIWHLLPWTSVTWWFINSIVNSYKVVPSRFFFVGV